MAIKTKQWYEAHDQFGDGGDPWYNYFFELGNTVKYLSVEPNLTGVYFIKEKYDEFEDSILDVVDFEEITLDKASFYKIVEMLKNKSKDNKREIIKGFLR
ncbi:MAG: hypothetical protein ACOCP4_06160 [Candidatus Woesearchaeota archaeon]